MKNGFINSDGLS